MSDDAAAAPALEPNGLGEWVESGFSAFFRQHHDRLVRVTYLVVGSRSAAEDIAQEAFVVAWRHWPRVSAYDRPDLWVNRVAVRMAIRHAARARLVARDTRETDLVVSAPEHDVELMTKVAALPAAQRAAVVLFYFEDRPVDQVAEIIGCATTTARVHLHRARTRLKVMLGEEDR